ncbi:DUF4084 domain-containing protein [Bacillus manliponensis]|uniref:DUF4084 domain-containing protein n=1 Tax=Bacillus manliponensis TaxID=574376 RepID=UPI0035133755
MQQITKHIMFITTYSLFFLIWILAVPSHTLIQEWGTLFLFYFASVLSAYWIFKRIRSSTGHIKIFWSLILCTCISGCLMEFRLFFKASSIYEQEIFSFDAVPFFLLQYGLLFIAFTYEFINRQSVTTLLQFLFDSVFITFTTFYFMFNIVLNVPDLKSLSLEMWLGTFYFIAQSLFVYAVISLYKIGQKYIASGRTLALGFFIILIYGYVYTFKEIRGFTISPEFTYFIHTVSLLLIGFASFLYEDKVSIHSSKRKLNALFDGSRIFLPYLCILAILFFVLSDIKEHQNMLIGLGISLGLLLCRQALMWKEHKDLLYTYQGLNEQLEIKVKEGIQALAKSEQQYKSLFKEHPDAVFSLDMNGNFQRANGACTELFASYYNEFIGYSFKDFIVDEDCHIAKAAMFRAKKGMSQTFEVRTYTKKNTYHHLHITLIPTTVKKKVIGMFGIARDITELQQKQQQIEHMAFHDALTGLPNRRKFEEDLLVALQHANKQKTNVSVLFIDLDRFKKVNDRLGHDIGDLLLVEVANRLKRCLRGNDVVARQGGDEFTIFLSDMHKEDAASLIGACLLQELNKPIYIKQHELHITPSIGISSYPFDGTDPTELMKNADIAMYHAKATGKNKVVLFSEEMSILETEGYFLESELSKALKQNEFYLQYQPQVSTTSNEIIGFEALVRWKHPKLGVVPPAQFIPIAEETGFIIQLGEWVLRTACKQAKEWHDEGFAHLTVAVNLSPAQFNHVNLLPTIKQILKETALSPEALNLEITESIAINKEETVIQRLQELQALGIKISIDDFGTGYSSLSYLTKYPIHTLKIAREFIHEIENSPLEEAITSSIITLAKNLQLTVIAEGVETDEQRLFLHNQHCDQIQGFLISKPIYPEEVWNLLKVNVRLQTI